MTNDHAPLTEQFAQLDEKIQTLMQKH